MNIMKTIKAGLKAGTIALLGIIASVAVGALTLALGFKPEGMLAQTIFTYVIAPILAGVIGLLNNYVKHKDDGKVEKK